MVHDRAPLPATAAARAADPAPSNGPVSISGAAAPDPETTGDGQSLLPPAAAARDAGLDKPRAPAMRGDAGAARKTRWHAARAAPFPPRMRWVTGCPGPGRGSPRGRRESRPAAGIRAAHLALLEAAAAGSARGRHEVDKEDRPPPSRQAPERGGPSAKRRQATATTTAETIL